MANEMTPGRRTILRVDISEPIQSVPPYAMFRAGTEIARSGLGDGRSQNVTTLATGAFALEPLQDKQHYMQERSDNANAVIPAAHFDLSPQIMEKPSWRTPSDLFGVVAGANVAATGGNFLHREIEAGKSWPSDHHASDVAAFGQPQPDGVNIPQDRHGVGLVSYPADQPFYWRFEVPGHRAESPEYIATYFFGGPASQDGQGQFCLLAGGDGYMGLYEKAAPGSPKMWVYRDLFRYAEPHRVVGLMHSIRIWPHRGPGGGGHIEFRSGPVGSAPQVGSLLTSQVYPANVAPLTHVYTVPSGLFARLAGIAADAIRQSVTGPGNVRFDVRQDIRPRQQFSVLRYPKTGLLADLPFGAPFLAMPGDPLILNWVAEVPPGCELKGKLYDATTDAELTPISRGLKSAVYAANPGQTGYYATFEYKSNSDQSKTPLLWSYSVARNGQQGVSAPGAFEAGILRNVSVTGPESDPSHETASVALSDLANANGSLNWRARQAVSLEMEYDPADPSKRSVLVRGYAVRNQKRRRGTTSNAGLTGQGAPILYPSPSWAHWDLTILGMWTRLHESLTFVRKNFGLDETMTQPEKGGPAIPWKVTDIIRLVLTWAGFPDDMIDVPDSPIRLFAGKSDNGQEQTVEPLQNIAEFIASLAKNYLGWYLIFDGNAGTRGMWRLRPPTLAPYDPVWNFVTTGPGAGKLPHRGESYGNAGFIRLDGTPGTAFVRRDTLTEFVKPPEANWVMVTGTGELLPNKNGQYQNAAIAVNVKSFDFTPGSADPSDPDYIGSLVPLVIVDTTLAGNDGGIQAVCRREYNVACHAIPMKTFDAPLVLFRDPNDAMQTRPRALRYYDPVSFDGERFLVRNCNPIYRKDGFQWAKYELEKPRF